MAAQLKFTCAAEDCEADHDGRFINILNIFTADTTTWKADVFMKLMLLRTVVDWLFMIPSDIAMDYVSGEKKVIFCSVLTQLYVTPNLHHNVTCLRRDRFVPRNSPPMKVKFLNL